MSSTKVSAYTAKTKQAEIFRRAAAGEKIVVTKNGKPQVEIRQARSDQYQIRPAVKALKTLQQQQLDERRGGSQKELKKLQEQGRD